MARDFTELLGDLMAKGVGRVHLFIAAPNSVVFTLGRHLDDRLHPEVLVYQYERSASPPFPWAVNRRDLALFNMAVDSKLRGCDLVCLKVRDIFAAGRVKERASVTQSKTGKPVRFEITETTRQSLERWIADPEMLGREYLWPTAASVRTRVPVP